MKYNPFQPRNKQGGNDSIILLWGFVIQKAITDYRRDCDKYKNKYQGNRYRAAKNDARNWLFRSEYQGQGSLHWICRQLDLDVSDVRSRSKTCDMNEIAEYQRSMEARG